ncbi:lycopene beta-cyclase [Halorubrum gandharaense]
MHSETYLGFLAAFLLPPIVALALLVRLRPAARWGRVPAAGLGIILVLAMTYTTPWDNLLIERGVWWYGDGVTAVHVWAAPLGEYLFFVLQPVLTALFLYQLSIPTHGDLRLSGGRRLAGVVAGLAVAGAGVVLLIAAPSTLYLGAILAWAGPILAIQWGFGWPHLVRARRPVLLAVAVPTLYLWILDWYAITVAGLWTISETYTVGIAPFGLPVEEMLFFLVTNVFVVQGLVLWLWLVDQWPTVADDVHRRLPDRIVQLIPAWVFAVDSDHARRRDGHVRHR